MSTSSPRQELHLVSYLRPEKLGAEENNNIGTLYDLSLTAEEVLQLLDFQRDFIRTYRTLQQQGSSGSRSSMSRETQLDIQKGRMLKIPITRARQPAAQEEQACLAEWVANWVRDSSPRSPWTQVEPRLLQSLSPRTNAQGNIMRGSSLTISNDPAFFWQFQGGKEYPATAIYMTRADMLRCGLYLLDDQELEPLLPELAAIDPDKFLQWLDEGFTLLGQPADQQRPLPQLSPDIRARILKEASAEGREKIIRAVDKFSPPSAGSSRGR